MKDYKICNLYSGSKGNSTFISASGAKILIDAGKSARSLCGALSQIGESIENIDAIFITHEHSDHVSALQTLTHRRKIPIHILLNSAYKFYGLRDEALCDCLCLHNDSNFEVKIRQLSIKAFPTPHDSRASVGYRFSFTQNDKTVSFAYATDIGFVNDCVKQNLSGCESVIIESNHDKDMLLTGPYPEDLKRRIMSKKGHLSNSDCAGLISYLVSGGTKNIMLAHLSEENNTPSLAYSDALSAIADDNIFLTVASPDRATWLIGDPDFTADAGKEII